MQSRRMFSTAVCVLFAACAPVEAQKGAVPSAPSPASTPAGKPAPASPAAVASAAEPASAAQRPAPAPAAPAPPRVRFPDTTFPPEAVTPPHERSKREGDGVWRAMGNRDKGERIATDPPLMVRTELHPHEVSRFKTLTVVAIDLRHVAVRWLPGTDDPQPDAGGGGPAGLVPPQDHAALLAVFNGGFKPEHGGWGMMLGGQELVPPRDAGCVVVLRPDDTVHVGTWIQMASSRKEMTAFRQTPPCLVEDGHVHPALLAGRMGVWAGQNPKLKTRRRSALGVDASGRVLLYGMGEELEPPELAEGMRAAGAKNAAQLDINWSWTRFLVFGEPGEGKGLQITSTLIPKMVHTKKGYVENTAARDFFYVVRRSEQVQSAR